ncbi:uncharacterized protein B0H18DRAFT_644146 [Fomitopsis serialis]|uniref:uncharacterized protein n=1 Tax=Fomitopsis serialis TaxID=139415 RepID=UPI002008CC4F|nr:uncharacterized protein B0H18DRAFT_644146 [Neoantrodia serialis]KAH9933402.1 hypothetical protein B0H18DRAFT_644146 [Neoantrodia serialis]
MGSADPLVSIAQPPAQSVGVLKLPAEIIFEILSLLDVSDLLEVRKTCMDICRLSQDRSVWLRMLLSQRSQVPIPSPYDGDPTNATLTLGSDVLERLVLSIYYTERSWLLPRAPPIALGFPDQSVTARFSEQSGNTALFMEVLADRWLLAIYNEGLLYIWDLFVNGNTPISTYRRAGLAPETNCRFSTQLSTDALLSSACASLSEDNTMLFIATVSQQDITVSSMQLPPHSDSNVTGSVELTVHTIRVWKLPNPALSVRAIHPASNFAFFSYSDTLVLLQWDYGKVWQLQTIDPVNDEDFWTGVIAAKFISPRHILCFKTHDVELLALPNTFSPNTGLSSGSTSGTNVSHGLVPIRAFSHFFPGLTFRGVSVSDPEVSLSGIRAETRVRVSFLAYDILRGLFHFRVSVLLPPLADTSGDMPDIPPPHMAVRLLAVHRLAQLYTTSGDGVANVPRSRSGFTPGSRGFVSACFMGRTGKRGVWIERRRGSMRRSVIAFSTALDALDEDDFLDNEVHAAPAGEGSRLDSELEQQDWTLQGEARTIDGRVIYEVNSYDLRDDITHCAFAEAMGTVVLGNRKGDLNLL